MHTIRDFWRRSWMGKMKVSAADVIGTLILCGIALFAIAVWFGH
jgi:hypothetical protein